MSRAVAGLLLVAASCGEPAPETPVENEPPPRRILVFDPTILSPGDSTQARDVIDKVAAWLWVGDQSRLQVGGCGTLLVVGPGRLQAEPTLSECVEADRRFREVGGPALLDSLEDAWIDRAAAQMNAEWLVAHELPAVRDLRSCILTSLFRVSELVADSGDVHDVHVVSDLLEACDETGTRVHLERCRRDGLPYDSVPARLQNVRLTLLHVEHDSLRTLTELTTLRGTWADALASYGVDPLPTQLERARDSPIGGEGC